MMNDIRVVMANLPTTVNGYSVVTPDGWTTIVLNQNLSYEKNQKTFKHEVDHMAKDDFLKLCHADEIEKLSHK